MGTTQVRGKQNRIRVIFVFRGERCFENSHYFCETGKKDCKCRSCKSAKLWLGEIERKISEGSFKYGDYFPYSKRLKKAGIIETSSKIKFSSYAHQWFELNRKSWKPSTEKTYNRTINRLIEYFGKFPLADMKTSVIQGYVRDKNLSPKTFKNEIGLMSSILKQAFNDDIIPKNPCASVKRPKVKTQEVEVYDYKEIISIIDYFKKNKPQMATFFATAFYTGMRTSEILALKWEDIDWKNHKIMVRRAIAEKVLMESTKTGENRTIDLLEELEPFLNNHKKYTFMKDSGFIFLS